MKTSVYIMDKDYWQCLVRNVSGIAQEEILVGTTNSVLFIQLK
ncbi:hypothetical protein [Alkalibacterium sp. 20]|nr:hypothetical protein [Alkalibacterium sp. 20]